jgi:hypothetical protein
MFLSVIGVKSLNAQTTAGNAVYSFLQVPYSAKASALGGMNISSLQKDLGLAMFNPSLLHESMDGQMQVSVKPFFADIKQYDVNGAHFWEKKNAVVSWGVHYMDYGNIAMTDVSGNEYGNMHPTDYAVQVSAAANYFQNITIGATLKFIQSNYGVYKSNGVATDIALLYSPYTNLSQASIIVKNLGTQFGNPLLKQELPFNLILGWTKKLAYAPFSFSITAERLSVWNNAYYDPVFSQQENITAPSKGQDLINHLILGSEINIGEQVNINLGYNFLRRYDLNIQNQQNWFNGFSSGIELNMGRAKLQYGTAFFQRNMYHHFTIGYALKRN